jgi:membrane associated rhomboid family serine protease
MIAAAVDKLERGIKNSPARLSRFCATRGFPLTAQLLSRVDVDAPLTLSFLLLCCLVQLLKVTLGDTFVYLYFAVPSWSLFRVRSLRCWATLVTQVLGHTSWEHLFGNVSLLLLTGPTNERCVSE